MLLVLWWLAVCLERVHFCLDSAESRAAKTYFIYDARGEAGKPVLVGEYEGKSCKDGG